MKPGVIDTNILLYAVNSDSVHQKAAEEFLLSSGTGPGLCYLTEGIVYEFLRVATHHRVFDRPLDWDEAIQFLSPILDSEYFRLLSPFEHHWQNLSKVLSRMEHPSGNLFFDIRTVVLMQEHGVNRIYSADTDFLQFTEIEVVNPLKVIQN